ncbi:MAG: hypothetical protein KA586_02365 [Candidatus Promineofilum sp.]|nr:hypothetical protein [Promineifilum sp.]
MNDLERRVRAHIIHRLWDNHPAPDAATISATLGVSRDAVVAALRALADTHRLALFPGSDKVWMAHPFSAVATDFVVRSAERQWYANCVWDGLAILGFVGDGVLETHTPQWNDLVHFHVVDGRVRGDGIVHFLVPAHRFWDDIGFT